MMKGLPMTVWKRKADGSIETAVVDLVHDVLFVSESEDRQLTLHTRAGEYHMLNGLEQLERCVPGYLLTDAGNVVNLRQAKQFDPNKLRISFEGGTETASVAAICKDLTRDLLQ